MPVYTYVLLQRMLTSTLANSWENSPDSGATLSLGRGPREGHEGGERLLLPAHGKILTAAAKESACAMAIAPRKTLVYLCDGLEQASRSACVSIDLYIPRHVYVHIH